MKKTLEQLNTNELLEKETLFLDRPLDRVAKYVLLWSEEFPVDISGRVSNDGGEKDVLGVDTCVLEIELKEPNRLLDGLTLQELQ